MKMNKKTTAILATGLLLASAGGAYAYWTTTGSGTGSATTGTTSLFTIVNAATTGSALSPNGPTQTATFNVHNPGSGSQFVSSVVVSVANSDGSPWTSVTGCSASDFSLNTGSVGAAATLLPAENLATGADSTQQSVTIRLIDSGSPQNGCKSVTVPLHYSVS